MQALVGQDPEPSHRVPAPVQPPLPQGVQGNARVRRVQLGRTSLVLCPHLTLEVTAAQRGSYVFWIIPYSRYTIYLLLPLGSGNPYGDWQVSGALQRYGRKRLLYYSSICLVDLLERACGWRRNGKGRGEVMRGRRVQGLLFTESNLIRKTVPFFLVSFLPSNLSKS